MIETLLPFAIALLVLSQISERIGNFLKLNLPHQYFGNLDVKEKNKVKEKIRERKIMAVSLVAGLITTSLFFGAYVNPAQDDSTQPPWVCYLYDKYCFTIPLMAFFLSFGSKFWHDLLDILFLYKNAQRVIRTGEGIYASSADEVGAMLAMSSVQIARKALADKKQWLMSIPGVVAVGIGSITDDEPTIRVYHQDQSEAASKVPSELPWEDNMGIIRTIRIEKNVSGLVMAQSISVGGKIALQAKPSRNGTVGFVFHEKYNSDNIFISTCYHVLRPDDQQWGIYTKYPPDTVCHPKDSSDCGAKTQLRRGGRTDSLDLALAKLGNIADLNLDSLPKVSVSGKINQDYADVRVKILTKDGLKYGFIQDWETKVEVHYNDGTKQTFTDFFSIRHEEKFVSVNSLSAVTKPGDSGAAVFFTDQALGMVVGASDKLTYAMKVTQIENNYGITIFPHPDFSKKSI